MCLCLRAHLCCAWINQSCACVRVGVFMNLCVLVLSVCLLFLLVICQYLPSSPFPFCHSLFLFLPLPLSLSLSPYSTFCWHFVSSFCGSRFLIHCNVPMFDEKQHKRAWMVLMCDVASTWAHWRSRCFSLRKQYMSTLKRCVSWTVRLSFWLTKASSYHQKTIGVCNLLFCWCGAWPGQCTPIPEWKRSSALITRQQACVAVLGLLLCLKLCAGWTLPLPFLCDDAFKYHETPACAK